MDIDYFYSLTPRQFNNIVTGYRNKEETALKNGWEQTRQLMHVTMLPHLKIGANITAQDVIKFPWEDQEVLKVDKALEAQRKAFWDKVDKKK